MNKTPEIDPEENRSRFAYSSPFQVFSKEGLKVLKEIIQREEKHGTYSSRGAFINYVDKSFVDIPPTCGNFEKY